MSDDFLSRLKAAREAAAPAPWTKSDGGAYVSNAPPTHHPAQSVVSLIDNADLICLLVNKAEAIELLIDAVTDAMPELDVPCRDACIHFDCGAIRGMEIALAALDGPTEKI